MPPLILFINDRQVMQCVNFKYSVVQNTKDNPPCNTLFIGNLGENINEEEVRGLFSVYVHLILSHRLYC